MSNRSMSGYWVVVSTMTTALAVTAGFQGTSLHPSPVVRVLAVLLAGAILLIFRGPLTTAWRWAAQFSPRSERERHTRDPAARAGADKPSVAANERQWQMDLAHALRDRHGWRWRYRQPWLLFTGNDQVIANQIPALVKDGWLVTDDAVLLWRAAGSREQADEGWLKQLYRLRRRRPVDAVVFAVDGTTNSFASPRGAQTLGTRALRIADALHWSAPIHVVVDTGIGASTRDGEEAVGCVLPRRYHEDAASNALSTLSERLAVIGTRRLAEDCRRRYLAALSLTLEQWGGAIARFCAGVGTSVRVPVQTRGIWFIPASEGYAAIGDDVATRPEIWHRIGTLGRRGRGRRVGWHPSTVGATIVTVCACLWIAGMAISATSNTHELLYANQLTQQIARAQDDRTGLRALLDLQRDIERFEYRASDGAPWYSRFGLNRDAAILNGLWQAYGPASRRLLVTPVQHGLESSLATVASMRTDVADQATNEQALQGHKTLRTYLMLADPTRADAKLMEPELVGHWLAPAYLTTGEHQDLAHQLFPFFARHLAAHPGWAIQPRSDLVNSTRQVLLAIIGTRNSTDTIYHAILDAAAGKYSDQSLATLLAGTDARGMFHTSVTVPGVFTRQAYDGQIAQAIDDAAQRQSVATDWVLSASALTQPPQSSDALTRALRGMYFDDYGRYWQGFGNSIQWERTTTLPAIAEQLRLLSDSRQSPLIALMKALDYQGCAGENVESLSDTLVARAQGLIGKHEYAGAVQGAAQVLQPAAPLDATFGPVLRLVSPTQTQGSAATNLSLQRYLDAVTTLRLKIEAMTNSGNLDDQVRQIAQAQFQGKSSDLSDTRNYASLVAASLGEQWSGLGGSLFLRPVDQAMQAVLEPAQASLNDAWRQGIVAPWTRAFQGRYPFATSDDDASFPELVRFVRDETGLVPAFINQQLAGALELHGDRWVPGSAGGQGLRFDPAFLKAINVLQGISSHLLASGAAQYRFDLTPLPTADVTETLLTLDGQKLKYFNQADRWQPFVWPGNDLLVTGVRLEWQTVQSGLNKSFERDGRWAFIRMLASARVEPLSDARFKLTWLATPNPSDTATEPAGTDAPAPMANDPNTLTPTAPVVAAPKNFTYPLSYVMRTDAGKGPLELLALRGFTMPTRIFAPAPGPAGDKSAGPPPLPASAVAAGRHAAVPMPRGLAPDRE